MTSPGLAGTYSQLGGFIARAARRLRRRTLAAALHAICPCGGDHQ